MNAFLNKRKKEEGAALIVVLWTVIVLAFAVAIASERVELSCSEAVILERRYQAELMADSAAVMMVEILKKEREVLLSGNSSGDLNKKRLDLSKFMGFWSSDPVEFEGGHYRIEIRDEHAKINWVKTSRTVWKNLFDLVELPTDQSTAWLDAMKDWQDSDENHALNGAESSDYTALPENRRKTKNAPITEMGELPWILGSEGILDLKIPLDDSGKKETLWSLSTVYGNGQININTAPPILVAAATGKNLETATLMVRQRLGADGLPGTADDIFLKGASGQESGNPGNPPSPTGTSTNAPPSTSRRVAPLGSTTDLFRLRVIGEYLDQQVVREALAKKGKDGTLKLLEPLKTMEERMISRNSNTEGAWPR